jgi:hypothetical protein
LEALRLSRNTSITQLEPKSRSKSLATSPPPIPQITTPYQLNNQPQQHHHDAQRNRRPPTPATRRPNPQLRPRAFNSFHALERPLRSDRLLVANRGRAIRQHGTGFPARRLALSLEQRRRNTGGRSRGVQCARKGHPDRSQGYSQVWWRVSYTLLWEWFWRSLRPAC